VVNDLGTAGDGAGNDASPAQQVVEEIISAGGTAMANFEDVTDWDGAKRLVDAAIDSYGDLNVLVNNAGILRDTMSFNMDEQDFDAVIRVHLKGHFAPTRWRRATGATSPRPARTRTAASSTRSSEAGIYGNVGQANYSAAKGGIYSMTLALARELKRFGVTANAIAPGPAPG